MWLFKDIIKESLMEFEPDAALGGDVGPQNDTWNRRNSDIQLDNGRNYRPISTTEIRPWSDEKLKEKRRDLTK